MHSQRLSDSGQNIRFLCIAEVHHQGVLAVLMDEALLKVFGVHILCSVGLMQVDLLQPGSCGINHLVPK